MNSLCLDHCGIQPFTSCPYHGKGQAIDGWKLNKAGDIIKCPLFVRDARSVKVKTSPSKYIIGGVRKSLANWARTYNIPKGTLQSRLKMGMTLEEAVNMPYIAKRPIIAKNIETGEMRRYAMMKDAEKDGFIRDNVRRCIDGKQKQHHGWTFEQEN